MGEPNQVKVATNALREYARYLRGCYDTLETLRNSLGGGRLPLGAWGVYGVIGVRTDSKRPDHTDPAVKPAPANLRAYKEAYEAAHTAAMRRLMRLRMTYSDTAAALEFVANRYDSADLRKRGQAGGSNER